MTEKDKKFAESLVAKLKTELVRYDYPSLAIGILKDGEVLLSKGLGFRDAEKKLEADERTNYASGSCGKAYTVALLDILVDRGLLSWDEPVIRYCPELAFSDPYVTEHVTLRDLLSHRVGLPRHDLAWYNTTLSKEEVTRNMRYMDLNQPFRTTFQYSNQCYMIAGHIIERMTGLTYEEALKTMLFEPLGMTHPAIFTDDVLKEENKALPYDRPGNPYSLSGKQVLPIVSPPSENLEKRIGDASNPAGCINIDVEDSLKWLRMLLGGGKTGEKQLIREETLRENFTFNMPIRDPSVPLSCFGYGMGWFLGNYRGEDIVFHGGNIAGYTALTFLWPRKNIGMIFFNNFSLSNLGYALMYTVLDHELDLEAGLEPNPKGQDWFEEFYQMTKEFISMNGDPLLYLKALGILSDRVEGTRPSHPLEDYCGTYTAKGYGSLKITLEEGALHMKGWLEDVPLAHYHYETFVIRDHGSILGKGFPFFFHLDDFDGSVENLSMRPNREPNAAPILFRKEQ